MITGGFRTKNDPVWNAFWSGISNPLEVRLRQVHIPLPTLALQKEFDERLGSVNVLRGRVEDALVADDELFASLQARAFRGEL